MRLLAVLACASASSSSALGLGQRLPAWRGMARGGTSVSRAKTVNLLSTVAVGALAVYDIRQTGAEAARGLHRHGLALVCASRLCRSLAQLEGLALRAEGGGRGARLRRALVNPRLLSALCYLAIGASAYEVWEDLEPGGHHGALLLSVSELHEVAEEAAGEGQALIQRLLENRLLKLGLAGGALAFAALELAEDILPGAHHGVALLAAGHVLKALGEWREAGTKED